MSNFVLIKNCCIDFLKKTRGKNISTMDERTNEHSSNIFKMLVRHDIINVFRLWFAINILFASQPGRISFILAICFFMKTDLLPRRCSSVKLFISSVRFSLSLFSTMQNKQLMSCIQTHMFMCVDPINMSGLYSIHCFYPAYKTIQPFNGPKPNHRLFATKHTKQKNQPIL